MSTHVEYLGFKAQSSTREYAMRVKNVDEDDRHFTVIISNDAFLQNRVRYQDAPEICFIKLQRELVACAEGKGPSRKMRVTDAELDEYRVAHGPKPRSHGIDRS